MIHRSLALIAATAIFSLSIPARSASGNETDFDEKSSILTVSATGKERVSASVADVRLAVEERGETHDEARGRMAERVGSLLDYLRRENVDRLETASLQLHPIHDYTAGDRPVVGYQASVVVRFRVEVPRVTEIIDRSLASGANQVQELVFTAPEDEIEEARRTAARAASSLALQRADTVLEELELQRVNIHRIDVNTQDDRPPPSPVRRMETRGATQERAAVDIEAGEHEITATVTLQVRYGP